MLAMARDRVSQAGVANRVSVIRSDAKETGFEPGSFDVVLSNSLVHHVPEPAHFLREVQRVSRPGAGLFIKDLHRPETEAELDGLVAAYASDCSAYQRRLFADSLRAALTVAELTELCIDAGLVGVTIRRCSDRHWCLERPAEAST